MDLAKKEKERKEGIKKRKNTKRDMEGCTDKEGWKEGRREEGERWGKAGEGGKK